jgi:tetratricopeptide (TPR) repeat protein
MSGNVNQRIQELMSSALSYLGSGDMESAIEELKTADILDNNNPEILYNLGVIHSKQGLHKTAIPYYEKILSLPSSFIETLQVKKLLAYSRILTGLYAEAVPLIRELVKNAPSDTTALSLAGYAFEKAGKIDEAITMNERVVSMDPQNLNASNSLAYLLAVNGRDLDRALTLAKKALDSNNESAAYNDTIGFIYFKKNQNEAAKRHLKKAFELDPASEEIRNHLHELLKLGMEQRK